MSHQAVPTDRVTQLLRLIRETTELPSPARKLHLARGLRSVLGCEVVAFVDFPETPTAGTSAFELVSAGFDDAAQAAVRALYMSPHGTAIDLAARAIFERGGAQPRILADRRELVSDGDWYRSPYVDAFRHAWGIDHSIYTLSRSAGGMMLGMNFSRAWGDRPFSEEDRAIADLFHAECTWLLGGEPGRAGRPHPRLAPRVRQTLDEMLCGASSKEIAGRLGLSLHTVRQYEKVLHRTFEVQSRGELLALFVTR
jgi:DNA-binding CsgD family transcriptional regulator